MRYLLAYATQRSRNRRKYLGESGVVMDGVAARKGEDVVCGLVGGLQEGEHHSELVVRLI